MSFISLDGRLFDGIFRVQVVVCPDQSYRSQIRMAGGTCQMYFRGTTSHRNSMCCGLIDAFAHVVSSAVARGRSRRRHHRFGSQIQNVGDRRQVY